jgi:hypothetical protein
MVSVLASSVVDHGFKPWSGQTKDYKIGICCFSAKHAALRRKSKDWLAWNQDNVSRVGRHVYPQTRRSCITVVRRDKWKNQRFPNVPVRRTILFPLV